MDAAEACAVGLVEEQIDPANVLHRAVEVAGQFASSPSLTFALHKDMLRSHALQRINMATAEHAQRTAEIWTDPEVRAFAAGYLDSLKKRA